MAEDTINNHEAFTTSVAALLRGDDKHSECARAVLPFTVLRHLDGVLTPVQDDMLAQYEQVKDRLENSGPVLDRFTEIEGLWNASPHDFKRLLDDPNDIADDLRAYLYACSPEVKEVIDKRPKSMAPRTRALGTVGAIRDSRPPHVGRPAPDRHDGINRELGNHTRHPQSVATSSALQI